ncbi:hypothetical protein BGZ83_000249 [Gryganskiella cystojenkinii]|nr:hypothetical protein BGZ83_000249 [Gryganskiella cystojenkinii]
MSLSDLPLECLQLILQELLNRDDRVSLSRLLQVSRSICLATLPFLYHAPFHRPTVSIYGDLVPQGLYKLVQMLLRNRPFQEISPLLSAAFDVFPEEQTADAHSPIATDTSLIDYHSYIRVFDLEQAIFKYTYREFRFAPSSRMYPPRLENYIFKTVNGEDASWYGQGRHDHELLCPPGTRLNKPLQCNMMSSIRFGALATSLRVDLTWALCSPVLEEVQNLTIPLSDMDRYLNSVDKFQSLVSVNVRIDEDDTVNRMMRLRNIPGYETELAECTDRKREQFKALLTFVERHLTLFPNQLQEAGCLCDDDNNRDALTFPRTPECPQDIQEKLMALLSLSLKPRSIDQTTWNQVTTNIKETDLGAVRRVFMARNALTRRAMRTLIEQDSSFLRRCRTLEILSMVTQGPGSFRWSVEEKEAWDTYKARKTITTAKKNLTTTQTHISAEGNLPLTGPRPNPSPSPILKPLPLKSVQLYTQMSFGSAPSHFGGGSPSVFTNEFKDELDDLVFAYGETTLTELYARACMANIQLQQPILFDFKIGKNWKLAVMKSLVVMVSNPRLLVDRELLSKGLVRGCCDSYHPLERLELRDRMTGPYRCQDLYSCQPPTLPLPNLKEIALSGWPALTFNPDTLSQTPNLVTLEIEYEIIGNMVIGLPPRDELEASFSQPEQKPQQQQRELLSMMCTPQQQYQQQQGERQREGHGDSKCDPTLQIGDVDNIHPVHIGGHRAPWTWDWFLPYLQTLYLGQEFAFLFRFQMLACCPALRELFLRFDGDDSSHERILSLEDFICLPSFPGGASSASSPSASSLSSSLSTSSSSLSANTVGSSVFVVASSLKKLILRGRWSLDDDLRKVIFPTVFPNLDHLSETGTFGYTLQGWLETLRPAKDKGQEGGGLTKLLNAHCGLRMMSLPQNQPETLFRAHGLVPRSELEEDFVTDRKGWTRYSIEGGGEHWFGKVLP